MGKNRKRIVFVFLSIAAALLTLGSLLIGLSVIFISHISRGHSVLGILDRDLFDSLVIQNATDYLALIIGLPITILVSLIALSLAYLAYDTAKRDERREAQGLIKQRRDKALDGFSCLASALNNISFISSDAASEIAKIILKESDFLNGADGDPYVDPYGDPDKAERMYLESQKRRTKEVKQKLLELHRSVAAHLAPAIDKIMSDPICREFLLKEPKAAFADHQIDCLSGLYRFIHIGQKYIGGLKDHQVEIILKNFTILVWHGLKVELDRETLEAVLIPPQRAETSGLALLASLMPPDAEIREPNTSDLKIHPDMRDEIVSAEFELMVNEIRYTGPAILYWLVTRFPTQNQFRKQIKAFFGKQVPSDYFEVVALEEGSFHTTPPQKYLLDVVDEHLAPLKSRFRLGVYGEGNSVRLENLKDFSSIEFIRTHCSPG